MAKWESRFKGEYLSSAELGDRRPTFTIKQITIIRVDEEKPPEGEDAPKVEKKKKVTDKPVMWFKEIDRGFMYCKTTGHSCAAMFGEDDDGWIGKRITLYADPNVRFGSEQVGGIRVAGSPDITKPLTVRIKFPKKRAFEVQLVPTKAAPPQQSQQPPASALPVQEPAK